MGESKTYMHNLISNCIHILLVQEIKHSSTMPAYEKKENIYINYARSHEALWAPISSWLWAEHGPASSFIPLALRPCDHHPSSQNLKFPWFRWRTYRNIFLYSRSWIYIFNVTLSSILRDFCVNNNLVWLIFHDNRRQMRDQMLFSQGWLACQGQIYFSSFMKIPTMYFIKKYAGQFGRKSSKFDGENGENMAVWWKHFAASNIVSPWNWASG